MAVQQRRCTAAGGRRVKQQPKRQLQQRWRGWRLFASAGAAASWRQHGAAAIILEVQRDQKVSRRVVTKVCRKAPLGVRLGGAVGAQHGRRAAWLLLVKLMHQLQKLCGHRGEAAKVRLVTT